MTHMWNQEIVVSAEYAQQLIESQSSIRIKTISYLDKGFDNTVFLINDKIIVRFPHRDFGATCMKHEIKMLPYLKNYLSFAIPDLIIVGKPTNEYPYQFAGYNLLPGELLTKHQNPPVKNNEAAKKLGLWLRELHKRPILPTHSVMLTKNQAWRIDVVQRKKTFQERIIQYNELFIQHEIDTKELLLIADSFLPFIITQEHNCYVHGDLYAKHILFNPQDMPTGIIDWGDVHIGNPGLDLALGYMIFDQKRLDLFFKFYGEIDTIILRVAQFKAFYHSILSFCYFAKENEESTLLWVKFALHNIVQILKSTL